MPKWTKKDYEMVAHVLHTTPMGSEERARMSDYFKSEFRQDNPAFDGARFDRAVHEGSLYRSSGRMRVAGEQQWRQKTYEMTASVLRRNTEIGDDSKLDLAWHFATIFGNDNPDFKILRFLSASGIPITAEEAIRKQNERTISAYKFGIIPPIYHGPEERYGGRRPDVPVRRHVRRAR